MMMNNTFLLWHPFNGITQNMQGVKTNMRLNYHIMIRSRLFQFILIIHAPEITTYLLSMNIPLDLRNHARLEALKLFENTNKYFSLWMQPPLPPSRLHKSILIESLQSFPNA